MRTYILTLKNKEIDKKAHGAITALSALFVRYKVDAAQPDTGEIGFVVTIPFDVYDQMLEIAHFDKVFELRRS